MESLQSRQQGYKDQVFANQQRGRTRDQWGREDATLERQGGIDTLITDTLSQIEASNPTGMGAQEVRQAVLSQLPKGSDSADRAYAIKGLDAALLPYEAKSALDVEMDAEDDALLRTQYDINNNIFAQDNPLNSGDAAVSFMQEKDVLNLRGDDITAGYLQGLLAEGLTFEGKNYPITGAMLAGMTKEDRTGTMNSLFDDAWDQEELETALFKFIDSDAYKDQFEKYKQYQAESGLRAQLRRGRNPLRRK
jgi:hypothetical protein